MPGLFSPSVPQQAGGPRCHLTPQASQSKQRGESNAPQPGAGVCGGGVPIRGGSGDLPGHLSHSKRLLPFLSVFCSFLKGVL